MNGEGGGVSGSPPSPCGHRNPPNFRFCDVCGARLPLKCARCHAINRADANFCGNCGTALRDFRRAEATPPIAPAPASAARSPARVRGPSSRPRVEKGMAHSTALSEGIPFGLRCKPFQPTADPAFFFPGGQYGAALEQIVDCLGARRGACLLTGEPGTGKTIVLRRVLDELAASNSFVPMSTNAPLHLDDLVWLLGDRVASSTAARSGQTPWDDVPSLLRGLADAGRPVALAIDEAQALDDAMFGQLAPLVETGALASLLLVGQPALVPRLEAWAAQGLEIAVHCSLDPLRVDEVGAYIAHRCRKAGCEAGDLFSSEAVERIASVSGGVPRLVNLLGSAALATGERQGARRVEPNIVDDVAAELGLVASVTSARPVGTPPGDPPRPTPRPARANNRPSASREGLPPKHVPLAGMTAAALIAGAVAMLLVLPLLPRTSPTAPPASNVPARSPSDRAGAPPAADPSGPASEGAHAQVTEPLGVSQATEGTGTGELPAKTPSPDPYPTCRLSIARRERVGSRRRCLDSRARAAVDGRPRLGEAQPRRRLSASARRTWCCFERSRPEMCPGSAPRLPPGRRRTRPIGRG
jgi:type II secretory pathway predicted ATPase ExeA